MRSTKWTIAAVTGVAVAAATAGTVGLASADTPGDQALDYVDGLGAVENDWNDHTEELGGPLCDGCETSSGTDLVILWQSVLAAEGELGPEEIDGVFGTATADATTMWQGTHDLEPTGEVDEDSWSVASQKLEAGPGLDVRYNADETTASYVQFERYDDPDGTYSLISVSVTGEQWVNEGGEKIEHFNETVDLQPL